MSKNLSDTLKDRGTQYGAFEELADHIQRLKRCMRSRSGYMRLSDDKREALDMIALKIGRIINGNPNNHDSWHDIAGYATLVANEIKKAQDEQAV